MTSKRVGKKDVAEPAERSMKALLGRGTSKKKQKIGFGSQLGASTLSQPTGTGLAPVTITVPSSPTTTPYPLTSTSMNRLNSPGNVINLDDDMEVDANTTPQQTKP